MMVIEYEVDFHELASSATSILDTKYERVRYFVRGLRLPLCMSTQGFIAVTLLED